MIKTGVVKKNKIFKIEGEEDLLDFEKRAKAIKKQLEENSRNRIDKAKAN